MLNTTRLQTFAYQIDGLLRSQTDVNVERFDRGEQRESYVWVIVQGPDQYQALRDENGPILNPPNDPSGKLTFIGECEFWVQGRVNIDTRDTGREFLLRDEGYRVCDVVEKALKYGGTIDDLTTANYFLEIFEVTPTLSGCVVDPEVLTSGHIEVHGIIRYKQTDL